MSQRGEDCKRALFTSAEIYALLTLIVLAVVTVATVWYVCNGFFMGPEQPR